MKRANLSNLLFASVSLTEPGKKLTDQLALMSLPTTRATPIRELLQNQSNVLSLNYYQVPQPSSDEAAWWQGPGTSLANGPKNFLILATGYPKGLLPMSELLMLGDRKLTVNPFDSPEASSLSSSPSTSDEELYNDAFGLQSPKGLVAARLRKPPPPPPPRQPG